VKTVSDKVVRHSLAYLSVQKYVARPLLERQSSERNRRFAIYFRSLRLSRYT